MAAELRRRGFSVVLAGRDGERLRALATELGDREPGDSVDGREVEIGIRQVGVDDPAALADAFRGSEAVVNVAGPFTLVGEPVVRAAIEAGTHYLDTTAEQLFVKKIFDEFSDAAEDAGVTVLPATGFYVVPVPRHVLTERLSVSSAPVSSRRSSCSCSSCPPRPSRPSSTTSRRDRRAPAVRRQGSPSSRRRPVSTGGAPAVCCRATTSTGRPR
ncbi:saccharopine dehydrogenase NADP-binding domain-containing protein [Parafrankia colletiae]|uniref:saccharopine dehydrogenase NADP-binding domain-containing protein n=1 Tax=Parafrankia colletiae TaxID=573497 RepID=UPI0012FFA2C6